jgi:ATP phosphoribosyltransferase regulatory subunit
VELLDAPGPEADAEVIGLAGEALKLAGIKDFRITLGQVEILTGVLAGAGFAAPALEQAKLALNKKDLVAWDRLIAASHLARSRKKALAALPSLHGGIEVLDGVADLIRDGEAWQGLAGLRKVWDRLADYGLQDRVSIDLTLLRGLAYYTGIVFEGYAPGVGYPLCGGGRYDKLLAKFGFPCPATGFALSIERVLAALEKEAAPHHRVPDCFITGGDPREIVQKARALRQEGLAVEIEVTGRCLEESLAYASRKGIPQILVLE